jgi:putative NADH-flavin reductase
LKIFLLGATGRVGSIILENALQNNHTVQAVVRDKNKLRVNSPLLTVISGDVCNQEVIAEAIKGTEVVISALNTGGATTLSDSMPLIIKQMKETGIKRIITIGTAGILQARSNPEIYRFQSVESKRKSTKDAREHLKAYLLLKDSGLDWTVVCPTYLPDGKRVGLYRYEKDILPDQSSSISIYDTGDFAYEQLFQHDFIQARVGLTY